MDTAGIEARLREILTGRLGIPPETISLDARLVEDLGMDSLDAVELGIAAERAFDVGIAEEQVAQRRTVRDIVTLIERLRDGGAPA